MNPNRPEVYVLLGPIYERQERYDEALQTYQRLEALDANLPAPIFAVMASIYYYKKMTANAIEYAQKALTADRNSWRAHYLLGSNHADANDLKKAMDSYQEAIKFAPNQPGPHGDLAQLYFAQKRYDDALKAIDEAIRLAPTEPTFREQRRQIREGVQ